MFEEKNLMILVSVIWGFGLAILLRKSCEGSQCNIYKSNLDKDIIKSGGKCYKLEKYASKCTY